VLQDRQRVRVQFLLGDLPLGHDRQPTAADAASSRCAGRAARCVRESPGGRAAGITGVEQRSAVGGPVQALDEPVPLGRGLTGGEREPVVAGDDYARADCSRAGPGR
jgi:hypothetical protein